MSTPVQQASTGVEIPLAAPFAIAVSLVVGPPGCRPEPQVPIHNGLIGLWLRSEPVVLKNWDVDRSVHRLEFAEFALMNPLDGLDKVRDASPLRAGLEDPLGLVDGIG